VRAKGYACIAGVDEAGRGPLAGPVVAAAVILPFEIDLKGVRDSKQLSPAQRDAAFDRITEHAEAVGIGMADVGEIDRMNILRASQEAMRRAVAASPVAPEAAIVDGLPVPRFPIPHFAVVKGDARSVSVAAASIIAKVTRDRLLIEMDARYPQYGFAEHKGYPTPAHLAALEAHGPCPEHRRSFGPVARLCEQGVLPLGGDHVELGDRGEAVVVAHVERLGWQVLAKQYRCRGGEIDVIAREGETVAFVEVKTRSGGRYGSPVEAVDARKRERMLVAAQAFLAEASLGDSACRFDVAEVRRDPAGLFSVNLIRGAFIAGE
jgi:ribonuclease HII